MRTNARLTDVDKEYIESNWQFKTDKAMAETLQCNEKTVARYRKLRGFRKNAQKGAVAPELIKDESSLIDLDETDIKLARYYKKNLLDSARGARVKESLTAEHFNIFIEQWIQYHLQLDELTHTEENDIEQMILLKIRIYQNQKDLKNVYKARDTLMDKAGISSFADIDLNDEDESEENLNLMNALALFSNQIKDLNSEYKDMLDKSTKLNSSLNVTREQREKRGKVGGDTLFSKIKELQDRKIRAKEGRQAELLKVATDKNMDKLRETVEYMDGEFAPQLLDSRTVEMMEEQKAVEMEELREMKEQEEKEEKEEMEEKENKE